MTHKTRRNNNRYFQTLGEYGVNVVSTKKFIPKDYLQNSVEHRKMLLAGLMDSDGSCSKNRTIFHTTSKQLSLDIKELVQSLGGIAIINEYDRSEELKGIEFQVNIRTNFNPFFAVLYKYDSWTPSKVFKVTRYIKSVEFIGNQEQQCISVSSNDKLYLTNDFIVTHNTLQSIGTIYIAGKYYNEPVYPCLVICPSALKINWAREWEMWTGKKAMVLNNDVKDTWHRFFEMGMHDVFIVNYESLKKYFVKHYPPKGQMKSSKDIVMDERIHKIKSIIIDESHKLKDPNTQQTKITLQMALGKEWLLLLSGTPVVNKPIDLFSQLAIMSRLKDFGGAKTFKWRYCEGGKGASNLKELNYMLNDKSFFRREKKDVVKDLPDKQRQTILCDITNRTEYNKAKNDFVKFLMDNGATDAEIAKKLRGEIMVKMGELKRISAKGKMNEVKDFVHDILESGEKLILFCNLHSIVDDVLKLFPGAVTVTGRDDEEGKQRSVDRFQKDPKCQLIVCNIKAAGVGITLTASSRVAFIEYPWTYADCVQCEDRAHRIGQKNSVMCTYFLGNNTIDEDLYRMIQEKRHTANTITGATDEMKMNFVDNVMSLLTK